MTPTYRLCHSGAVVDLIDPKPETIRLRDIAHHLSRMCRFGGACDQFLSVAQHCVHTSILARAHGAPREVVRWAALHDALEYVCDDLGSPVKQVIREHPPKGWESWAMPSEYDRLCSRVSDAISTRFGVPRYDVKRFDWMSMLLERRDNGPHGISDADFLGLAPREAQLYYPAYREILEAAVIPWSIDRAEYEFLFWCKHLEICE